MAAIGLALSGVGHAEGRAGELDLDPLLAGESVWGMGEEAFAKRYIKKNACASFEWVSSAKDAARLEQMVGGSVPLAEAAGALTRLGLRELGDGRWQVPTYRLDLQRHVALAEEVVRVAGRNAIPARRQSATIFRCASRAPL